MDPVLFIAMLHMAIPVLGILLLAIRRERLESKKLLDRSIAYIVKANRAKRRFR